MRYPGGKGRLYPRLINLIPPHQTYIEPFAGGAAVLRYKRPAQLNIAVDRDLHVLARLSALRLKDCSLICADALSFLQGYNFTGTEFLYCDPPYLAATRRKKQTYRYEFDYEQHLELLKFLLNVPCLVLLSGYPSSLYSERLKNWNCEAFPAKTHAGWANEKVWYNYAQPRVLHDGRYLGDNFRQRYNTRRRLRRLRQRLSGVSAQERAEVYKWLQDQLGEEAIQWPST